VCGEEIIVDVGDAKESCEEKLKLVLKGYLP
jgi:hypothetical protein